MRQLYLAIFLFVFCNIKISGQIPDGYYNGTEDLTGIALKNKLYSIIKGHTQYPYTSSGTDVWDILKQTDKDTLNSDNVILLYTGWSINADQEYNDGNGWAREHVWAKSHGDFGTEIGPGTDIHALRPCDVTVNEKRSNLDFATGGTIYMDDDGITECKFTTNSWEPRDSDKGDVARMIFYMAVRYEGENGEPNLEAVDYVNSSPNYEPLHGKLSDLLTWHESDPPNNWERNRNDIIYYQYQHNRNPFIDHPEFAAKIFGSLVTVNKPQQKDCFEIYPNPVKDLLYIRINDFSIDLKSVRIELADFSGRILIKNIPDSNYIKLPCHQLPCGYYILKTEYNGETILCRKIIID